MFPEALCRNERSTPDLDFLILFLFILDWGSFPQMFLVFLKTDITTLHRKASLNATWATRGLHLPQDAQGVSTEEVVVADVLVASDIYHLQNQEREEAMQFFSIPRAQA